MPNSDDSGALVLVRRAYSGVVDRHVSSGLLLNRVSVLTRPVSTGILLWLPSLLSSFAGKPIKIRQLKILNFHIFCSLKILRYFNQ
jgi:hypothetical protein